MRDDLEAFAAEESARDPEFAPQWEAVKLINSLIALRVAQGISQADLGARMGVTQSQIARFESKKTGARLDFVLRYALCVGASIEAESHGTKPVVPSEIAKVGRPVSTKAGRYSSDSGAGKLSAKSR